MEKASSVLIIDNDNVSNYMTRVFFEKSGLFEEIHFTSNGKKALEFIEINNLPDLILLDLYTPIMDGFEFIEELNERGMIGNTRIIFYTTDHRDKLKKYKFSVINKPLTYEKFCRASQLKVLQE